MAISSLYENYVIVVEKFYYQKGFEQSNPFFVPKIL
jgi:hypothetical protein